MHSSSNNCTISEDQFDVLAVEISDFDILIKESILIKQLKPNLNNTEFMQLKIL